MTPLSFPVFVQSHRDSVVITLGGSLGLDITMTQDGSASHWEQFIREQKDPWNNGPGKSTENELLNVSQRPWHQKDSNYWTWPSAAAQTEKSSYPQVAALAPHYRPFLQHLHVASSSSLNSAQTVLFRFSFSPISGPLAWGQCGRHLSDTMMDKYVMNIFDRVTMWRDGRERETENSLCSMERGGTSNVKMLNKRPIMRSLCSHLKIWWCFCLCYSWGPCLVFEIFMMPWSLMDI